MAVLKQYSKAVHDIHTYSPDAIHTPRVDGWQTGWNGECQGNKLEWSGVSIRPRSFCRMIGTTAGFTEPLDEQNINFWNTCNPCVVLISPKHGIVCQHYRGTFPRQDEWYTFMDKNGTRHSRKVVGVTLDIGPDHTLLEFETPFPPEVTWYDRVADLKYVPEGQDIWVHDCNGKAYKLRYGKTQLTSTGGIAGFSYGPVLDGINTGISQNGWVAIHVGDSGSPAFILDEGKTVLLGLMHGGNHFKESEVAAINGKINAQGYTLIHHKVSATAADLNGDGVVDGSDLGMLMARWGSGANFEDLNGDGVVNSQDLSLLLAQWGDYRLVQNGETTPPPSIDNSDQQSQKPRG